MAKRKHKPKLAKLRKKRKTAVKPRMKVLTPVFSAKSLFRAKIKVIGVGGGGGSIVSEIGRSLKKATFVVADTDFRALKKKPGIKYFWFGQNFTHGLGTGLNPELAKEAAENEKEKIFKLFKDQDIVILIASLGGGLGSGAAQVFAEAASSFGAITLGIFTLPFKFEGKKKISVALGALKNLRRSLNVSLTIPNEKIFKVVDKNTAITEAFSIVNKNLIESLESLIDLIYNPGLINIDFADLRTILNGKGNLAFLNTIEESGKDRADKICQKVFYNPLYQNSGFTADKILFNVSGGSNLSMFEVEKISRTITDINPEAKVIFGISKNPGSKNKIKAILLMTGPGIKAKKEIAKTEEKKPLLVKVEAVQQKSDTSKPKKKFSEKKPVKRQKKARKKQPASSLIPIPVFNRSPVVGEPVNKLNVVDASDVPVKKAIRRNALEIKKAEAMEENKKLLQEKQWEIPAFLRRVKFKS